MGWSRQGKPRDIPYESFSKFIGRKSLLLNALIGRVLLPTDGKGLHASLICLANTGTELPSTAWPCRVQHIRGQTNPTLEVNAAPFQEAIDRLRQKKYGAMMSDFEPSPRDEAPRNMFADFFGGLLDDAPATIRKTDPPDPYKLDIYEKWNSLHPTTKRNLCKFEEPGFRLTSEATGEDEVKKLVSLHHRRTNQLTNTISAGRNQ